MKNRGLFFCKNLLYCKRIEGDMMLNKKSVEQQKKKLLFLNISFVSIIAVSILLLNMTGKTLGSVVEVNDVSSSLSITQTYGDTYHELDGAGCPSAYVAKINEHSDEYAYCLNLGLPLPSNITTTKATGEELPKGIVAILEHGYPNGENGGMKYGDYTAQNRQEAYFITQYAIWLFKSRHMNLFSGDKINEVEKYPNCLTNNAANNTIKAVNWLLDIAEKAQTTPDSVVLTPTSNKLTATSDGRYYESGVINVTTTGIGKLISYAVTVNGATVIDKTATSFRLQVPSSNITANNLNLNVSVSATFQSNKAYLYGSGNSTHQDMVASILGRGTAVASTPLNMTIDAKVRVGFAKVEANSQTYVAGAVLELTRPDGTTQEITTKTEPVYLDDLLPGNYSLREKSAPSGYIVNSEVKNFTVKAGQTPNQVITFEDDFTKILISKVDAGTNKAITGATFLIRDQEKNEKYRIEIEEKVCKITDIATGTVKESALQNNACLLTKIPIGKYTLEETKAPDGYVLNDQVFDFEVRNDGKVQRIVVKHNYTRLLITGHNLTVDSLLVGITFQIKDHTGKEVISFTTNGKPYTVSNLALGKYTIQETKVPEGFVLNKEPVEFEVTGEDDELVFANDYTKLLISKRDITNQKEVPGAKLELRDAKGKLIDEWTSTDGEEHLIERLKPGKYTLKETLVPEGYTADTTEIEFEVKETGEVQKQIMYNTPIVDVPDTASSVPIIVYVLGIIILACGAGLIYVNVEYFSKNGKKGK